MRHLKKSFIVLTLLTSTVGSRTCAQDSIFHFDALLKTELTKEAKQDRAKEVMQDNEYVNTGHERGVFLANPLMINGKPLDYSEFNLESKGELTVNKETATGQTIRVPFYVYLRRNGSKVFIPERIGSGPKQTEVYMSEILKHGEPGDQLVIEAVNKEDGRVKRILKLRGNGC